MVLANRNSIIGHLSPVPEMSGMTEAYANCILLPLYFLCAAEEPCESPTTSSEKIPVLLDCYWLTNGGLDTPASSPARLITHSESSRSRNSRWKLFGLKHRAKTLLSVKSIRYQYSEPIMDIPIYRSIVHRPLFA